MGWPWNVEEPCPSEDRTAPVLASWVRTGLRLQENDPVLQKPTPHYLGMKHHLCNFLSYREVRTPTRNWEREGGATEGNV